ncbi:SatD family protein [Gulosibacter chungangensis]|uniref:SatD family protein n=1 Tax=Gulosibacter chungangensis TaxID=979746 RepID=UPI001787C4E3|nr:SatD family protein [Gulosibacter chungangensis]
MIDQVASRHTDRTQNHPRILAAIETINTKIPALDPLRVTVGDEIQAVYETLGDALRASHHIRANLFGEVELRFGIGLGDVEVIDAERGIQDGSAWWRARAAIEEIEQLAAEPGTAGLRTGIRDERSEANPLTVATARLVDTQLFRLRPGAREALRSLLAGLDNQTAAKLAGITPSANSQRIINNDLRTLAEAIETLGQLP